MSNTEIPAQEVDLSTRRQRLFHVTWLNRSRLDKLCRPLLMELERSSDGGKMGVLAKATFRGAVTLINHYLHFDIREHPSAIFLILLKLMDDRSFDAVWTTYKPIICWVDEDGNSEATDSSSETSPYPGEVGPTVQLMSSSRLSDVNGGNEGKWEDHLQQNTPAKSSRRKADSNTGQ